MKLKKLLENFKEENFIKKYYQYYYKKIHAANSPKLAVCKL